MTTLQFYTISELKALINFIYKLGFYPKSYIIQRSVELNISVEDSLEELLHSAVDHEISLLNLNF